MGHACGYWATYNALYRVDLGYEQSPGKGQKAAPNLAVEEQSKAPTWATELAIANASLTNRLLHSKGPATWPRLFAKAKLAEFLLSHVTSGALCCGRVASSAARGGPVGARRWRGGGSRAPDPDIVLAGPDSPVEPAMRV